MLQCYNDIHLLVHLVLSRECVSSVGAGTATCDMKFFMLLCSPGRLRGDIHFLACTLCPGDCASNEFESDDLFETKSLILKINPDHLINDIYSAIHMLYYNVYISNFSILPISGMEQSGMQPQISDADVATPSNSQEMMLLGENTETTESLVDVGVAKKKSFKLAPAKLTTGIATAAPSVKNSRGEITTTFKMGLINSTSNTTSSASGNIAQNSSHNRSTARRTAAKRGESANVDAGIPKPAVDADTPKRCRESGQTPESQTQKKKNRKIKQRLKVQNNLKGNPNKLNANATGETGAQGPPAAAKPQLSGPRDSGTSSKSQTVDLTNEQSSLAPPVTDKLQLTGADKTAKSKGQPNSSTENEDEKVEDEQQTYASVASNLSVAIIDQRSPDSMTLLDVKKFDTLYTLITDKMLSQVGKNVIPPNFEDTRLHSGALRVRCADLNSRQWLEKYIPTLDKKKLWKDASLVVIDFANLPKPYKFNVFIRGMKKSAQNIFKLFELQNKGISTKSWTALACEYKNGGTSMTIGVGQDSFDFLRQKSNLLFCGLGKATFNIVKSCKENRKALQQNVTSYPETGGPKNDAKPLDDAQIMDVDDGESS